MKPDRLSERRGKEKTNIALAATGAKPGLQARVEQWLASFKALEDNAWNVCVDLVNLVREWDRTQVYTLIQSMVPALTSERLDRMSAAGSRQFPLALLFDDGAGAKLLRGLPYEKAEKYLQKGATIPLVVEGKNDELVVEYRVYRNIKEAEAKLLEPVKDGNDLATVDVQKARIESRRASRAKPAVVVGGEPFFVADRKVILKRRVALSTHNEIDSLCVRMNAALDAAL